MSSRPCGRTQDNAPDEPVIIAFMKKIIHKLLCKFYLGKAHGFYISSNKTILCSLYEDRKCISWQNEKSIDQETLINSSIQIAVSKIRHGEKRWPMLQLVICVEGAIWVEKYLFS